MAGHDLRSCVRLSLLARRCAVHEQVGRSDDEDADETSDDFWEQDEGGLIQGMIGKDTNSVRKALVSIAGLAVLAPFTLQMCADERWDP